MTDTAAPRVGGPDEIAHADPANVRSAAVAERLGMTREGTLRSSFVVNGTRHDTEIWAILSSEWRS